MDIRLTIGSALQPREETVAYTETPRQKLSSMGIAFQDGSVTLDGRVLGTNELDKTFEELNVKDDMFLLVNSKENGG
jgi:hypothetical protein